MLAPYLESLENASRRLAEDAAVGSSWNCITGLWPEPSSPEAAVFKLGKAHWWPGFLEAGSSTAGIFFSVWIDDEAIKKGGLHYNLHALKLRQLPGYSLESRKFASAFRAAFGPRSAGWPAVKMAFGPQTLFQGFVKCPPARVEAVAYTLARKFIPFGAIVDELLASAVKRPEPALQARAAAGVTAAAPAC